MFGRDCSHHCHCKTGDCDVTTGECENPGCDSDYRGLSCSLGELMCSRRV